MLYAYCQVVLPSAVHPSARRLTKILQDRDMTQNQLAKAIGVTQGQISRWLRGRNAIPQATAMAIETIVGARWQWLLNGSRPQYVDLDTAAEYAVSEFRNILLTLPEAQWSRIVASVRAMAELINSMKDGKPIKPVKHRKAKG
jgi:transcriptional regulator with XRE-family HTH domain